MPLNTHLGVYLIHHYFLEVEIQEVYYLLLLL